MAFNFPSTPTEGQEFSPATDVIYVYKSPRWMVKPTTAVVAVDWVDITGKPATFPPEVPIDWADIENEPATFPPTLPIAQSDVTDLITDLADKTDAAYVDAGDALKVAKNGDVMTGFLTLNAAPTADLHASTKKYVDDNIISGGASITYVDNQDALRVSKIGDTMTGDLTINKASPIASDPPAPARVTAVLLPAVVVIVPNAVVVPPLILLSVNTAAPVDGISKYPTVPARLDGTTIANATGADIFAPAAGTPVNGNAIPTGLLSVYCLVATPSAAVGSAATVANPVARLIVSAVIDVVPASS